jgi:cation-transporting P-type ATPase E
VLLTSAAFAVSVYRLAQRKVLVQELPAVEGLARVDVICLDKTGTLTEGDVVVDLVERLTQGPDIDAALGALAAADSSPNATLQAIAARFPATGGWTVERREPFSSARKYGAAVFTQHGAWVLGAPEVLLSPTMASGEVGTRVTRHAEQGRRVVLLARSAALPDPAAPTDQITPVALVLLSDRIRAEAPDTLRYFAAQDVAVKVISGDHPHTVAAMAERAGLHTGTGGVDARTLPTDADGLATALEAASVFGRVTPDPKRAMVRALQGRGHVVGMTGDGVNDVLALKQADIAVAMGSGTPAARGVSQVVLLGNSFAALPAVVAEGRRVIANIERVAKLFVTKSVYAVLLALAIGLAGLPFPFLPRHLSLIAALTIGIPGLWLALEPSVQRARPGFVSRVVRAALPAGLLAGIATFIGYAVSRLQFDVNTAEAQTTATVVLTSVGLVILSRLASPLTRSRRLLLVLMWVAFLLVLAIPALRAFFALNLPPAIVWLSAIGLVAVAERLLDRAPVGYRWLRQALADRWPAVSLVLRQPTEPASQTPSFESLLATPERQTVERKASLRWDHRQARVNTDLEKAVAKTVAGFGNSRDGGTLLLGMEDAGTIVGLEADYQTLRKPGPDGFELHLTEVIAKFLGPTALAGVRVRFQDVGGHDVCQVDVAPAVQPLFTHDGKQVAFHLRTGNSTRPLSVEEAVRYSASRWPGLAVASDGRSSRW